jgi:hypothetical protein
MLLGAGVAGAVAAVARSGGATASPLPPGMTESDAALLAHAMTIELAGRDLYRLAVDAGADPAVLEVLATQHASYGQSIAGLAGMSANRRNDELFDSLAGDFDSSDVADVAAVAYDLESTLVVTHSELLALIQDVAAAKLIASILAVESRHAIVLADLAGRTDVESLLEIAATPILPEDQP